MNDDDVLLIAEKYTRQFLGIDEYQRIPTGYLSLAETIYDAIQEAKQALEKQND